MITEAKKIITDRVVTVMKEKGYTEENDCYIVGDERAVKVDYNEEAKIFELKSSAYSKENGVDENFDVISCWLFDENSDERDAQSIANDFEDSLKEVLKLKSKNVRVASSVMEGSNRSGGVDEFTKRFIVIYPQYKEDYEENMQHYGVFLADAFFLQNGREKMLELLKEGNKKQIGKFSKFLSEFYEDGDPEVRSIITATILAGIAKSDVREESLETLYDEMGDLLARSAKMMVKLSSKK